jgi:acyl-CoA synthetase (AMP-forming)/AMP-acid ligase II
MNLMLLLEMASSLGERRALSSGGCELGYEELFRAAGAARDLVAETGVARVALLDESSPALPIALFGSAWAGVPFAPLNYRLTGGELERLLERVAPALLVTDAARAAELAGREGITAVDREAFLARVARAAVPAERPEWPMDPEGIAVLLFTSGTTGAPKAAVLRHQHLVSYILGSVEFGSAAEEDATLVAVPPYHVAGIAAIASSVYAGRRIVQLPHFDAGAWLRVAREERVSHAFVVPTMLARIVDALEGAQGAGTPALRAVSYGGGKMPLPVIERAMRLFPDTDFTNAYGLTETSSTIALLGPEDHRAAAASPDPAVRRRLASVGRPLPSVELEIRDEEGRPAAPGTTGEIHVRGAQVAGEYLEQGSRLDAGGWFPTRDAGFLDEEGYLFLEGRIDDVIVRGGENLSPGEIEDALIAHPAVVEVAVVGVPDEQWGEAVAAAVVLREGAAASEAELRQWVKERLRSSRTPDRIAFFEELPFNEMGKLLRRVVRERLRA